MHKCIKCDMILAPDEIGLFKKLVNKGAEKFMCIKCMAVYFEVSESDLYEKIKQYKELGCTLFK